MSNNPFQHDITSDRREMNKVGLSTYAINTRNNFDYPADQVIEKLERDNQQILAARQQMTDLYENERERFNLIAQVCYAF